MKRCGLIALALAAPLAAKAQFVVFTDNFTNSTLNKTSVPGGTPFASFTSYDIASTKPANTTPSITNRQFVVALNGTTTSGMLEAQAVFSPSPVSLQAVGDSINLTYIFFATNLLAGSPGVGSYIMTGLYNSGGTVPVAGSLNSSGLGTGGSSPFATGNCQLWQGYVFRVANGANSQVYTRPPQNGPRTSSANQDIVGGGNSGDFDQGGGNPGPVTVDTPETNNVTLANSAVYTISYTIALTAPGTLTFSNFLYSGAGTGGTLLFSQTNTATTTNVLTTSFDSLGIGCRNASSPAVIPSMTITNLVISEIASGLPGQPFNVTGGGTGCPGATFPVGLNGSVANNDYYLFTNGVWTGLLQSGTGSPFNFPAETVLTVPLTNTVLASNTTTTVTGLMIGSVLVAPNAPPVITNQPIPSVVANGSIGVFNVAASGGGLTYQWFKNGSPLSNTGNIMGATNSTLEISPAGAGDVANYYVTVTSGCGVSANSSTNGLSLDTAANLTWQGNNNSNWDLSITPNFVNGSTPTVFHNGDNVTLDDTATTTTVDLIGNFLAPGTITENSAGTYSINGPGTIQGTGSLVMNGSGSLNLNSSNAYTGGTTVKSGIVVLNNGSFASAGTGTITLAGGTLDIPTKAASAIAWSNSINITANSTLQFDQNGTEACVLDGVITGDSSATLAIHATTNGSTTARLRFYGVFTNNANIAFNPQVAETELAPYNPDGNQIYNGLISGTTGRITARGAGNAVLANQNTFNDTTFISFPFGASLLMSSGNIGIGADSVQSSPPTIDSSPVGTGYIALNVGNEGGNCSFFAWGGPHTIANQMEYTSTSNTIELIISGTNDLTFSGEFDLALASDPTGTNRTIEVTNTGATTFAGMITDNSAINSTGVGASTSGITKTGSGSLYLNGTNVYLGPTTNNGGLLAGSGYIGGPVIVVTNGTIGGGSAANIGTLTLSNNLALNGNVSIRVNKSLSPSQSNDVISVMGSLANTGTGTVSVNNLGSGLVVGDRFQIFNQPLGGGGSLTITGAGVTWNNNLASDGSISVQSVGPSGPTTNATITKISISGTNILIHGTNNNMPNTSFHFDVLTSTNVALPLSSWTPVATGLPFNPDGTFDYTNPIVPGTPRQFIDVKAVP